MSEVKWIKLSTDIFDNRKIKQIEKMPEGDSLIVVWLKLLVLAGSTNDSGMVYFTREIPYTEQLLSNEFNRPLSTIQLAIKTFQHFGMIDVIEDVIHISNWEKYQNVERMDIIREQTRQRVANYREKRKLLGNVTGNVTVTQSNATDIDKEEELEKEEDKSIRKRTRKDVPPTVEEVREYVTAKGYNIDPEYFVDYYGRVNWRTKQGPIKDWQACVRTWVHNDYSKGGGAAYGGKTPTAMQYEQRTYTDEEMKSFTVDLSAYAQGGTDATK